MSLSDLKQEIESLVSFIGFTYKNADCGVDPISKECFYMHYGESTQTAENIEDVMNSPFFDGKSLSEIFNDIVITDV